MGVENRSKKMHSINSVLLAALAFAAFAAALPSDQLAPDDEFVEADFPDQELEQQQKTLPTEWCYVQKAYIGPGHEFIKPSTSYIGKYYSPCGEVKNSQRDKKCPNSATSQDDQAQDILNRAEDEHDKNPDNPMVHLKPYALDFLEKQNGKCDYMLKDPGYLAAKMMMALKKKK